MIEAMKQALDALEGVLDDSPKVLEASISGGLYEVVQCRDAITALRTAIAEAKRLEPVAWGLMNDHGEVYDCISPSEHAKYEGRYTVPLYTTPPAAQPEQKQWDAIPDSFNDWWNADYDDTGNPYRKDSPAYWAWSGWKAASKENT